MARAKTSSQPDALQAILHALPVLAVFITPDGMLDDPDDDVAVWTLPEFTDKGLVGDAPDRLERLIERAGHGERVQTELWYRGRARTRFPDPTRRRGLLSLTPVHDEDGLVERIALCLVDCEDHGLPALGLRQPSRQPAAHARVETVLDLAQAVILTDYRLRSSGTDAGGDQRREQLAARLRRCTACSDTLSMLGRRTVAFRDLLGLAGLAGHERLDARARDAELPVRLAPALSLLLAELADNAARFGAWSGTSGRVSVGLGRDTRDAFVLDWRESGVDARPAALRGFGMVFAQDALPALYGGQTTLDVLPGGYHWRIGVPVTAEDAAAGRVEGSASDATVQPEFGRFDGGFTGADTVRADGSQS